MEKKLLYFPSSIGSFTNDETGEVIKGASIYLSDIEPSHNESFHGVFIDKIWISEQLYNKLSKDNHISKIPCKVKVTLETRGLKSKPKVSDIDFVD